MFKPLKEMENRKALKWNIRNFFTYLRDIGESKKIRDRLDELEEYAAAHPKMQENIKKVNKMDKDIVLAIEGEMFLCTICITYLKAEQRFATFVSHVTETTMTRKVPNSMRKEKPIHN